MISLGGPDALEFWENLPHYLTLDIPISEENILCISCYDMKTEKMVHVIRDAGVAVDPFWYKASPIERSERKDDVQAVVTWRG